MIKLNYNNMMVGKDAISQSNFSTDIDKINSAFNQVMDNRGKGWQEWTTLFDAKKEQLEKLNSELEDIRKNAESFVVLGIGGSALGPLCVFNALLHLRHNELDRKIRKVPKFYVEDNIDPERMAALLDVVDIKNTYFNVITKSGETSETLAQFLILYDILKANLGESEAKKRIVVTTTIGKGTLYNIAEKEGFRIYGIGEGVGGRFSVFSNVGLVPFAALGIDIVALVSGAKKLASNSENADFMSNMALLSAYLQVKAMENGKNISVMMPYSDALKYMSDFYGQLWGESLGKEKNLKGEVVNVGQTPAKALGVTDQHSQIQLYTEGPFDKVITIIGVEKFRKSVKIPNDKSIAGNEFLKGTTLENLLDCEMKATAFALTKANRLNFTILLERLDAESVGALLAYFMYKTAFAGALLQVDTYNQPGVEEGKKATFAMLKRTGFEEKLKEITEKKDNAKFIINC